MKKILYIPVLLVMLLVLTGCPCSSKFPISSPSVLVDKAWLGTFTLDVSVDSTIGPPAIIHIKSFSNYEYLIEEKTKLQGKGEDMEKNRQSDRLSGNNTATEGTTYVAHVSILNNEVFMNVKMELGSEPLYYLYKVIAEGNTIRCFELSTSLEGKFTTEAELQSLITRNQSCELLYGNEFSYVKTR